MSTARLARPLAFAGALVALAPWTSPAVALLVGIALALVVGNPDPARTRALAHRALTASVVGLGAGMDLAVVARVGIHGLVYTAIGITVALALGTVLGGVLHVRGPIAMLITVGTAICGGSAIAAIAPVIDAPDDDISVALVTVFLLNAVALFVFPAVGHHLGLGQDSFGLWSALAIHDTSSVVGAASAYGPRALEVATAAKLARALWIVPVTFGVAFAHARAAGSAGAPRGPAKRPWFIAGFVLAAAVGTFVPGMHAVGVAVAAVAHRVLALTLFLIGLGMSRAALGRVGARPLIQAIALWAVLATSTLVAITCGWIA